jgi:hypothetical protein
LQAQDLLPGVDNAKWGWRIYPFYWLGGSKLASLRNDFPKKDLTRLELDGRLRKSMFLPEVALRIIGLAERTNKPIN